MHFLRVSLLLHERQHPTDEDSLWVLGGEGIERLGGWEENTWEAAAGGPGERSGDTGAAPVVKQSRAGLRMF